MEIAVQTLIIGGIGLLCGAILAIASKYLAVHEDPRIEQITALLRALTAAPAALPVAPAMPGRS
jgi:Na+-translocating ferredoxin:NAD+ oxidoreductase RNF subunit RnfB